MLDNASFLFLIGFIAVVVAALCKDDVVPLVLLCWLLVVNLRSYDLCLGCWCRAADSRCYDMCCLLLTSLACVHDTCLPFLFSLLFSVSLPEVVHNQPKLHLQECWVVLGERKECSNLTRTRETDVK